MAGRLRFMVVVMLLMWALSEISDAGMSRERKKKRQWKKEEVAEPTVPPEINIDINQMLGKWYLLNIASKCSYLMTPGNRIEATTINLDLITTGPEQQLSVITKTRQNHQCWEIHQVYDSTNTGGFFVVKGDNPNLDTRVTILDTDYTSYAILVFEKQRKNKRANAERRITMKLYARSVAQLHEPTLKKFDDTAANMNLGMAYMFPPRITSHCDEVDKDHIINCIPTC